MTTELEHIDIIIKDKINKIDQLGVLICDKHMDQINSDVETGEFSIQLLIHPRRFSIISLLYNNISLKRSKLSSLLNLSSGSLEYELKRLQSHKLIDSDFIFVDDRPRRIYHLTDHGIRIFEVLNSLLD